MLIDDHKAKTKKDVAAHAKIKRSEKRKALEKIAKGEAVPEGTIKWNAKDRRMIADLMQPELPKNTPYKNKWPKRKMQSRPFPKGKRKMRGNQ
jgi:hypothetical protein